MRIRIIAILLFSMVLNIVSQAQNSAAPDSAVMKHAQYTVNHHARVFQAAMGLNDYNAAKDALLNILVEIPQNDSILFELGSLYFQMQQYASAVTCVAELTKKYPDHLGALEIAAISYENLEVTDKAIASYEALYLQTDDFQPLYKLALLQYELERYTESFTNLELLIARPEAEEAKVPVLTTANNQKPYPLRLVLLNLQGLIKKTQGDIDKARELFTSVLKEAPDFASANENLESLNQK